MKLVIFLCLLSFNCFALSLISIDKESENKLGHFPWDKKKLSLLISAIESKSPKGIIFVLKDPNKLKSLCKKKCFHVGPSSISAGRFSIYTRSEFAHFLNEQKIINNQNKKKTKVSYSIDLAQKKKAFKHISAYKLLSSNNIDLKNKLVVFDYQGQQIVKTKHGEGLYYYPGEVLTYFLADRID